MSPFDSWRSELLSLRGATVTMGAMGCQKGIAKAIVDKGAHYIFGLKGNHPSLHREVLDAFDAETFAALAREAGSYAVTVDKGHGRNEVRRVWVRFSYLLTVLSSGGVAEALSPRPRRATRASSVGT